MKEHLTNFLLALIFLALAGIFVRVVALGPPDAPVVMRAVAPYKGNAADGVTTVVNSMLVGGKTYTGGAQSFRTDTEGRPIVQAFGSTTVTLLSGETITVVSDDAGNFLANANMQQGDLDVSLTNPLYVSVTTPITVIQTDADVFKSDANMQYEDADVTAARPLPVTVYDVVTGAVTVDFAAKFVDSQETNTLRVVLSEESEVHDGLMFSLDRSLDVGDDVFTYLWMHVGASPAHVAIGVWGGGQLGVSLWETPTVSGGIVVEAHNLNRTSGTLPLSVISHTPSIASLGSTPLFTNTVLPGGTSNNTRIGGSARSTLEWIFPPNSDYLLGVQNVSGNTVSVTMELDWNEE
ncbi:hypothetical protein LCGC14_0842320 [marine sediment metagenome]|uniref:Uncharacterized protein n=1 Tax=marine sediment metagenome TaxID=412755 RepID=A0A0F9SJX1_9ZZZZ